MFRIANCSVRIFIYFWLLLVSLQPAELSGTNDQWPNREVRPESHTEKRLIKKYQVAGYVLDYRKNHLANSTTNVFFIFRKILPNIRDERGKRILVVCQKKATRLHILLENRMIIYKKGWNMSCLATDPLSRIVTNGKYITFEQTSCLRTRGMSSTEYITLKYVSETGCYILYKYSVVILNAPSNETIASKVLTSKDFGIKKLDDLSFKTLDTLRTKFDSEIQELLN